MTNNTSVEHEASEILQLLKANPKVGIKNPEEVLRKLNVLIQEPAQVEKKLLKSDINTPAKKATCPYCFNKTRRGNSYKHLKKVHFPTHMSDHKVAEELNKVIDQMRSNDDYADKLHQKFLAFWRALCSDNKTKKQKRRINKLKPLFEKLMRGKKEATAYLLTQLIDDLDNTPDIDIPTQIFRYCGKSNSTVFRHFRSTGHAVGNVAREIKKLVENYLARDKSAQIPLSSRLYIWQALKVPIYSLETIEHILMMALWQLSDRGSSTWNQNLSVIPKEGSLYGHNPKELVYLGLYVLHSLIEPLRSQIKNRKFFTSDELLTEYEKFDNVQRASFNMRYKIGVGSDPKDDENVVLKNLLTRALDLAKQSAGSNETILKEHDNIRSLMNDLGIEPTTEASNEEIDDYVQDL